MRNEAEERNPAVEFSRAHADEERERAVAAYWVAPCLATPGDRPDRHARHEPIDRNVAIARIRAGLKARTGRTWSVTGGRGTAWGWIHVTAPPARRTWDRREIGMATDGRPVYEAFNTGNPGHEMGPDDIRALREAMGLDRVFGDGISIPPSHDYYWEHVDRAEGRAPRVTGTPYWD